MKLNKRCPRCSRTRIIRKGFNRSGRRVYKCLDCNSFFTSHPLSLLSGMDISKRDFVKVCDDLPGLLKNGDIRRIVENTGIRQKTIKLVVKKGWERPWEVDKLMKSSGRTEWNYGASFWFQLYRKVHGTDPP